LGFWKNIPFAWLLILPMYVFYEILLKLSVRLKWGRVEKYGIKLKWSPPLLPLLTHFRAPIIDVGTMDCIKRGEIKILQNGIQQFALDGGGVILSNGERKDYDAIIFATGFDFLAHHCNILEPKIIEKIGKGYDLWSNGKGQFGTECSAIPGLWWQYGNLQILRICAYGLSLQLYKQLNPKAGRLEYFKLLCTGLRYLGQHILCAFLIYWALKKKKNILK